MKKLFLILSLFAIASCNDGDFDVPAFEFTEKISTCGSYVFYKTNTAKTETIALNLTTAQIAKTVGTATFPISSSLKVTYRLFNSAIGSDYFCQAIPPIKPTVLNELTASSGTLKIVTAETLKGYTYEITIAGLTFMDAKDRIFYETFNFGTVTILN